MRMFLTSLWGALSLPKYLQLLIMRLFQDQFLVGVTGVIFNKQKEILLFKHTYRKPEWSLPGGYIKAKEHPAEAIEREIKEESGFVVSADKQLQIRTDRETARLDICFIGTYIGGDFVQSDEVSEFGFFTFDNLPLISKKQLLLIEGVMGKREPLPTTKPATGFMKKLQEWFTSLYM